MTNSRIKEDDKGFVTIQITAEDMVYDGLSVPKQLTPAAHGDDFLVDIPRGLLLRRNQANLARYTDYYLSDFVTGVVMNQDKSLIIATNSGIMMAQQPVNDTDELVTVKMCDIPAPRNWVGPGKWQDYVRINNTSEVSGRIVFGTGLKNPQEYVDYINSLEPALRENKTYANVGEMPESLRPAALYDLDPTTLKPRLLRGGFGVVNGISTFGDRDITFSDSAPGVEKLFKAEYGPMSGIGEIQAEKDFKGTGGRPDGMNPFFLKTKHSGHFEKVQIIAVIGTNEYWILNSKLETIGKAILPEGVERPTMANNFTSKGEFDFLWFTAFDKAPGTTGKVYCVEASRNEIQPALIEANYPDFAKMAVTCEKANVQGTSALARGSQAA